MRDWIYIARMQEDRREIPGGSTWDRFLFVQAVRDNGTPHVNADRDNSTAYLLLLWDLPSSTLEIHCPEPGDVGCCM